MEIFESEAILRCDSRQKCALLRYTAEVYSTLLRYTAEVYSTLLRYTAEVYSTLLRYTAEVYSTHPALHPRIWYSDPQHGTSGPLLEITLRGVTHSGKRRRTRKLAQRGVENLMPDI
jgi:hypothetical protein